MNAIGLNNATGFSTLHPDDIQMNSIMSVEYQLSSRLGWATATWTHALMEAQAVSWEWDGRTVMVMENDTTYFRVEVKDGEVYEFEETGDPLDYNGWVYNILVPDYFCCSDDLAENGCTCACDAGECDCCCSHCNNSYDYCECPSCESCGCTVYDGDHVCGCDCQGCDQCESYTCEGYCQDEDQDVDAAALVRNYGVSATLHALAQTAKPKPQTCGTPGCNCMEVA